MKKNTAHFHGFSLIEVMIAVFVLSVGILAVAKFQGTLLQSGSETKAKTAALTLAEQKIDDLRSFGQITAGTDCSGATCSWPAFTASELNSKPMAFAYIDENEGGRLAPNTTFNLNFNNENYKRTWKVKDKDSLGMSDKLKSMKWVEVSVEWQDQNEETQTVSLESLIPAISPALTDVANPGAGASPTPPNFTYTPGAAPDVIKVAINAGDGQFKETSKVLPDVSHDGVNNLVTFSAVTYTTTANGSSIDNIDEYATVNCNCTFNASPGLGYTPARFKWDNSKKEIYSARGIVTTKVTGYGNNGLNSEAVGDVCDICCRDHHDSNENTPEASIKYSPLSNYIAITGDHQHYDSDGVATTSGNYVEACRLKVIDGILSTFQDWQLKTATVLPNSYLSDNSASTQADYKAYVSDYITNYPSLPTPLSDRNLTDIPTGQSNQIQIRNIYIDDVEQTGGQYTDCIDGIGISDDPCQFTNILAITPFTEINLSKLANWTTANSAGTALAGNPSPCPPADTDGIITCVTNEAIVDEAVDENNYSRGSALAVSPSLPGIERIVAYANPDNTGITGTAALSSGDFETTKDEAIIDANPHSDYISLTVSTNLTALGISGAFKFCGGTGGTSNKQALVNGVIIKVNGDDCTTDSSNYEYTCPILSGTTAIIEAIGSNATNIPVILGLVTGPVNLTANADKITLCATGL